MISLITPTGDRTEAFELTRKWIAAQTKQPDQWIVIDDGKIPLPEYLREGVDYVRREPGENEGHTLVLNIKEAVKYIKGDKILIIEDDDWYGPTYIETMNHYLDLYDLVGEKYARYYHLPAMKYRRIGNTAHASFCQTGFTERLLPTFISCIEGDPYIDARLWAAVQAHKFLIDDAGDTSKLHCSLKGLRGRRGIGTGHKENASYYNVDVGLTYLIKWVGEENARIYMNHVGQSFESAKLVGIDRKGHKVNVPKVVPITVIKTGIVVITCTGDRPETFNLCKKWMKTQTKQPDQWIVVDDGKVPVKQTGEFEYVRREPSNQDYLHTLCLNILTALEHVKNDKIIIMEDDDWYHPTYIDYMDNLLLQGDLVGLGNLIFYYPKLSSYMEKKTVRQPAFAQTAFHKNVIPVIKEICEGATKVYDLCGKGLIDVHLWKNSLQLVKQERKVRLTSALKIASGAILPKGLIFDDNIPEGMIKRATKGNGAEFQYKNVSYTGKKVVVHCDKYLSVGMKGLPGRVGLTTHHKIDNKKYKKDEDNKLLKSIIKNDLDCYREFLS